MCCCCGELYAHRLWVFLVLPIEDFVSSGAYWSIQPTLCFISLIIKKFSFFFCPPALFVCSKLLFELLLKLPLRVVGHGGLPPVFLSVPPGHHSSFWPRENLRAASPYDRERSVSQVPFPEAAVLVPAQYGGCTGHTDQQLRPQPGADSHRRNPKPSQPQHPLL